MQQPSAIDEATAPVSLERCHGFLVDARGRLVGSVETPLFPGATRDPDYLVVRTTDAFEGTFRFIPTRWVAAVDDRRHRVLLDADAEAVSSLPRKLPLDRGGGRIGR
jgi:hypothetical protein